MLGCRVRVHKVLTGAKSVIRFQGVEGLNGWESRTKVRVLAGTFRFRLFLSEDQDLGFSTWLGILPTCPKFKVHGSS